VTVSTWVLANAIIHGFNVRETAISGHTVFAQEKIKKKNISYVNVVVAATPSRVVILIFADIDCILACVEHTNKVGPGYYCFRPTKIVIANKYNTNFKCLSNKR